MLVQIADVSGHKAAAPAAIHRFGTEFGEHMLVVNGSRVYSIEDHAAAVLDGAIPGRMDALLEEMGVAQAPYVRDEPLTGPPLRRFRSRLCSAAIWRAHTATRRAEYSDGMSAR
jgi:hypothetical protein